MSPEEVEEVAERAANRALSSLGLTDADAARDMRELRGLLVAWRQARCEVARTVLKVVTVGVLALIAAAVGWRVTP